MKAQITFFLFILLAISSCTVEKRLYSKGFHIEFRKRLRESDSKDQTPAMTELLKNQSEEIGPDSTEVISIPEESETDQTLIHTAGVSLNSEKPVVSKQTLVKRSALNEKTKGCTIPLKKPKFLVNPLSALKEKQFKKPKNDRNYSQFWEIMGFIGLVTGLLGIILLFIFIENPICLLILQIVLAGLAFAGLIWLIFAICGLRIEWFWSGR